MPTYKAPVEDIAFVLDDLLHVESALAELDGYEHVGRDDIGMVLNEAARFCESEIQPINQLLDEQGCRLVDGRVETPAELRTVWRAFAEGGWQGLCGDPDDGGQGLPTVVYFMVQELISSASISFGDYAGLFSMAAMLIRTHAEEELKRRYLPGLMEGSLGATMCLTEPHCGTDVGLIRTKAEPAEDGLYRVSGTKIFISGGDHDLTDNIVHMVLARAPGGVEGPRGLSLYLVPKWLPPADEGGEPVRNAVAPVSLEHKMGYTGSATCQMAFDGALGWRVGEEGRGLNCMFVMVNLARLMVGAQGLCTAEVAYQNAAAYALDRTQGRSLTGVRAPEQSADPIIEHPDVRRMLLASRSFTEVARAVYLWLALEIDVAARHRDADRRKQAEDRLALLLPVVKAMLSDFGFNACNDCMQIFGGHGYIRANGMEQLVRDVRLAQIQEGANGILALDLLIRRVFGRQRDAYEAFVADVRRCIDDSPEHADLTAPLAEVLDLLEAATAFLEVEGAASADAYGAAGTEYLRLFGLTLFGWTWVRMVRAAAPGNRDEKRIGANFFMARVLPMAHGHFAVLKAGHSSIDAASNGYFAA